MVTVKVKYLKTGSSLDDFGKIIANETAESVSKEIAKQCKGLECEIHKSNTKGTLTIISNEKNLFKVEKSNFCCSDFEGKVNINSK